MASLSGSRLRAILVLGTLLGSVSPAAAQLGWTELDPAASPAARELSATAFDEDRARLLLFGGYAPAFGDTWEWDGAVWSPRSPAHAPSARYEHAMAYDRVRARIVLFGGRADSSTVLADTWEWDGVDWLQRSPATSPSARSLHVTVYDTAHGQTVLYGGSVNGNTFLTDTWSWDGTDWTAVATATTPVAGRAAAAYDPVRERVVLVVAADPGTMHTWEWDGVDWTEMTPAHRPPRRSEHALAFDPARGTIVLFGGGSGILRSFADTWEWDGRDWVERFPVPAPLARSNHAMAFDAARGRVLLFGGRSEAYERLDDTWTYTNPQPPAALEVFGAGCVGDGGVPAIGPDTGRLPWINETFALQVTDLPPAGATVMLLGFSKTMLGGLPLPVDLGAIGMPGCTLYQSSDLAFPIANVRGRAAWAVAICDCPSLSGTEFHNQAIALDPGANALGLIASDASTARIGGR